MDERLKTARTSDDEGRIVPRLTRRTFLSVIIGSWFASFIAKRTLTRAHEKEALFWRRLP
jgi:hypothetical protein